MGGQTGRDRHCGSDRKYDGQTLKALRRGPLPQLTSHTRQVLKELGISAQSSQVLGDDASTAERSFRPRLRQTERRDNGGRSEAVLPGRGDEKSDRNTRRDTGQAKEGGSASSEKQPARSYQRRQFLPENFTSVEEPDVLTMQVLRDVRGLENLLKSTVLSPTDSQNLLKILTKITKSQHRESVLKILQAVCASRFLDSHLPVLINTLQSSLKPMVVAEKPEGTPEEVTVINAVAGVLQLVSNICRKLPSSASKCSLLLTYLSSAERVVSVVRSRFPNFDELVRNLQAECDDCATMMRDTAQQKRKETRRTQTARNEDDVAPPEDFAKLSIFPDLHDMDWTEKPFLRANKAAGAFKDVHHYLDVQFRLLREDYIRPLRNGIREYQRAKKFGEAIAKNFDLKLYHSVRVIGVKCTEILQHSLQFDNTQFQNVNWNHSKRLQYGNLVCLTPDDFQTLYFAVITNTDVEDRKQGIVQVTFEGHLEEILEMSTDTVFTMAETPAFFEAYRHVLEGLQQVTTLPMHRYIVECHGDVKPPSYLLGPGSNKLNLTSLLKEGSKYDATSVSAQWPPICELELNESQLKAVQTAFTKELAIIQGPPGTGKTYVGLKVAKVLLDNKDAWTKPDSSRPILVVCYTNHALDQFLEGILKFCPKGIVRVGGRSKSEALEAFNLKAIRANKRRDGEVDWSVCGSTINAYNAMKELGEKVEAASALGAALSRSVLNETVLQSSMLPGQYDSLTNTGPNAILPRSSSLMVDWLAFGNTLLGQDEESDPYTLLKREVTAHILDGTDIRSSPETDLIQNPRSVSYRVRAQMYRAWLKLVIDRSMQGINTPADQAVAKRLHEMAATEILPDDLLKPVVDPKLYSEITSTMLKADNVLAQYCIRAWLGINIFSPDVVAHVVKGMDDNCDQNEFTPESVLSLPRRTRVRLYRFWLKTMTDTLNMMMEAGKKKGRMKYSPKQLLEKSQKQILSDEELEPVVGTRLFSAIKREMTQRLERQKKRCIRAWLGLSDFSRDPQRLQNILEQLTGEREAPKTDRTEKEEEKKKDKNDDDTSVRDDRQLDDMDDDDFRHDQSSNIAFAIATFEPEESDQGREEGWTIPQSMRKKRIRQIQRSLQFEKAMTQEEAEAVTDVWDPNLTLKHRVQLYKFWLKKYQPRLKRSLKTDAEAFLQEAKLYEELKFAGDCEILREASVIGMTTTGAARYRKVLASVGCPIVMIEEAAEVLEAHVVTTLHESCQHLILIGDHQQLRPSPTVYELCRHYQLDLSLFERLVNNKLPHSTLAVQHRMRPEVARLVRHVYPHLQDHVTTERRPHVLGVKENVFLFHHEALEETHDETKSKSNRHEAELCVRLCRYLLQQGYSPEQITILAAYTGQLLLIQSLMKQDDCYKGVYVAAVDNYQGEENDVIILSLVRSNEEGSVGFLGTDNRVCVALSRARNGLYAFGNFRILAERSDLWKKVVKTATENDQMGSSLVLQCVNHPDTQLRVTSAEDFKDAPNGGCKVPCRARLDCGHVCIFLCHPADPEHKTYRCKKKCERQVCKEDLHPCPKKCHEECGRCMVQVEKTVPACGHKEMVPCSTDPSKWSCSKPCEETLSCGHQCSSTCGQCSKTGHVTQCTVQVSRTLPCGHKVKSPCHMSPNDITCKHPCGAKLDCGHYCSGTCGACFSGRVHEMCKVPCEKMLPGCGHKCPLTCGTKCLPCKKECHVSCKHGQCILPCGKPCAPCSDERCPWRCEHNRCKATCDDRCKPCPRKCDKRLDCGHPCKGSCGEKCLCVHCEKSMIVPMSADGKPLVLSSAENPPLPSEEKQQSPEPTSPSDEEEPSSISTTSLPVGLAEDVSHIKLPGCGHIFRAKDLDVYVDRELRSFCGQFLPCPVCTKGTLNCWRYQRRHQERHSALQEAKKKLAKATAVPKDRQEKLLTSMAKLYAAKKSGNFASAEEREKLEKTRLGANRVLALTVQTKLSRVTEIVLLHLSKLKSTGTASSSAHTDIDRLHKSAEKLQHVLLKPATAMTDQRCRELTTEARRLSYMALLHYAKVTITEKKEMTARRSLSTAYTALSRASPPGASRSGPDAEGQSEEDARLQRVDKFLGMLEDRNLSMVLTLEIEEFFEDCRRSDRNWSDAVDDTIFAILNAPFEKDLCDVRMERKSCAVCRQTLPAGTQHRTMCEDCQRRYVQPLLKLPGRELTEKDLSDAEQQETRSTEDQKKEKEKLRQVRLNLMDRR